ncbi:hypothetical protein KIL84_019464 [Mauremys mutica]|uniref:Uncharacterized protein n=1 Tax=Mauremys mutica TaxID=74926 RepID=A0A9D3XX01_9SAUR|nr:hypothetical protein KIL84_019464 [Mauremys mutica]
MADKIDGSRGQHSTLTSSRILCKCDSAGGERSPLRTRASTGTARHTDSAKMNKPVISSDTTLSKIYGNVFSLQNCWSNMIVVNGFKAVKEALVQKSEDFADRPYFPIYEHLGYGENAEGKYLGNYHSSLAVLQGDWLGLSFELLERLKGT